MSKTSLQFQILKQQFERSEQKNIDPKKIRTINTDKWKFIMIKSLKQLTEYEGYDSNLIEHLSNFVGKITEDIFIEAIMNMQPLKLELKNAHQLKQNNFQNAKKRLLQFKKINLTNNFKQGKQLNDETQTNSSSLIRNSQIEQKYLRMIKNKKIESIQHFFIEQEALSKIFSNLNHPYKKIIDSFTIFIENKYKLIIEAQIKLDEIPEIDSFCLRLRQDLILLQIFLKMSSAPIVDIFKFTDKDERQFFSNFLNEFIGNFIRYQEKIYLTIRKIIKYFIKNCNQIKKINANMTNFANIDDYQLSDKIKIEGAYAFSTSSLIQFSECANPKDCLSKLPELRSSIIKDIDQYYENVEPKAVFEITSDAQIQILKFLVTKLKIFSVNIVSQLKYLEVIYGSEQMSYQFDDASYIHSQLLLVMEAIQNNL